MAGRSVSETPTTSDLSAVPPDPGCRSPEELRVASAGTRALLSNGAVAILALLGPGDADEVLALHEHLPERERYLRFSTLHPVDLVGYLRRTLAPGSGSVSLGARVRGQLTGVVQLVPVGRNTGEVAAVVHRDWFDHGVGTALLEQLAVIAWGRGIQRLSADVLAENDRMMQLLGDLGLPVEVSRDGPEQHIEVQLHADDRYLDAVQERHRRASAASLRPVLQPESVAVVGARMGTGSFGRAVLDSLREARFPGTVVAVSPRAEPADGVPCLASVAELPGPVDLAVIAVPATAVPEVLEDCGRRGVRSAVVVASGVTAVPGLPDRIRALADRYGMRIVGPNTVGVIGPGAQTRLDTTFSERRAPAGDVGLIAQSGGVALAAVSAWQGLGLGLSAMVATGDALDVGARDVLAWFAEDPGTRLVVLYAETEPDLRSLVRTAAQVAARVPVLALRAGSSAAGRRAVAEHTAMDDGSGGHAAGGATAQEVREAAFVAGGIHPVEDLPTLGAAVGLLRGQPLPADGPVVVLTNVGGGGVLVAHACECAGLAVSHLPEDLQTRLRAVLPPLAATANPVDTGPAVSAGAFSAALALLLDSPGIGAVVTVTAHSAVGDPTEGIVRAVAEAVRAGRRTPVIDVRFARPTTLERLDLPGCPPDRFVVSVNEPAAAARALAVARARRAWLARPGGRPGAPDRVDLRAARTVVSAALSRTPAGTWLSPPDVAVLCAAAGLPTLPVHWAPSPKAAAAAARRIHGPVAVKGYVDGVLHKADAGFLRLPVAEPREVAETVRDWAERAGAGWQGAVVQAMAPVADELLLGAVRDPSAGPLVVLGPGGPAADALGHRVRRLAPVGDADVAEMLDGTGLFGTAHGRLLDRAGAADCVRRVGWLADAVPELAELEVNPLMVTRSGCLAVDVRIRVAPSRM